MFPLSLVPVLAALLATPAPGPQPMPPGHPLHIDPFHPPGQQDDHDHDHGGKLGKPEKLTPQQLAARKVASRIDAKRLEQWWLYEKALADNDPAAAAKIKLPQAELESVRTLFWPFYTARRAILDNEAKLEELRAKIDAATDRDADATLALMGKERAALKQKTMHDEFMKQADSVLGEKTVKVLETRERDFIALLNRIEEAQQAAEKKARLEVAKTLDDDLISRHFNYFLRTQNRLLTDRRRQAIGEELGVDWKKTGGFAMLANEYYALRYAREYATTRLAECRERLAAIRAGKSKGTLGYEEELERYWLRRLKENDEAKALFAQTYGETLPDLFERNFPVYVEVFGEKPSAPTADIPEPPGAPKAR